MYNKNSFYYSGLDSAIPHLFNSYEGCEDLPITRAAKTKLVDYSISKLNTNPRKAVLIIIDTPIEDIINKRAKELRSMLDNPDTHNLAYLVLTHPGNLTRE